MKKCRLLCVADASVLIDFLSVGMGNEGQVLILCVHIHSPETGRRKPLPGRAPFFVYNQSKSRTALSSLVKQ